MPTEEIAAAYINVESPEGHGGSYTITQNTVSSAEIEVPQEDGNRELDWRFGPLQINGYVDTNTFDITVSPIINGISAGPIKGNMKDGLELKVNLSMTKGLVRWYLKNGNEIWTHLDLKIIFNGSYEGDYKIIKL